VVRSSQVPVSSGDSIYPSEKGSGGLSGGRPVWLMGIEAAGKASSLISFWFNGRRETALAVLGDYRT